MIAVTLTPEKLQQLQEVKKELAQLKQRSENRLALFENWSNKKLYCD